MPTTREYTDYLNDQIDIAPVNSQEELQAAELIEKLFAEHGLETKLQEFETPTISGLTSKIYQALLFVGVLLAGFLGTSAMAIGLVLVAVSFTLLVLAHNGNDVFGQIGPQARSQNVIGVHRAAGPNIVKGNRPIVIVAHYDTQRENPLNGPVLAKWQPLIKRYSWHLSIFVSVMAFFQVFGFLPAGARHVFWVLGILASLPLLLLGATSIYERFSSCTTGASDNKASLAAMLGVLDKVRPGTDDAKAWAYNHPKGVRRPIEELYNGGIEDDEELFEPEDFEPYDDEEYFDEEGADVQDGDFEEFEDSDAEGVGAYEGEGAADESDEDAYVDEDEAEDEGAFEDEAYDAAAESEAEETDEYDEYNEYDSEAYDADFEDEYGDEAELESYDEDVDSDWDDEVAAPKPVKPQRKSAGRGRRPKRTSKRAAKKQAEIKALEREAAAKIVEPTTKRRGASVLAELQVLPETCEVEYVGLAPRAEVLARLTKELQGPGLAEKSVAQVRKAGGKAASGFSALGKAIVGFFAAIGAFFAGLFAKLRKQSEAIEDEITDLSEASEIAEEATEQTADDAYEHGDDEYVDDDEYEDEYADDEYEDEYGDDEYDDEYEDEDAYEDEADVEYEDDEAEPEPAVVDTHVPVEVVETTVVPEDEWQAYAEASPEIEAQVSERLSLPTFDHIYSTLPDQTGISREAADAWLADGALTPEEIAELEQMAAESEDEHPSAGTSGAWSVVAEDVAVEDELSAADAAAENEMAAAAAAALAAEAAEVAPVEEVEDEEPVAAGAYAPADEADAAENEPAFADDDEVEYEAEEGYDVEPAEAYESEEPMEAEDEPAFDAEAETEYEDDAAYDAEPVEEFEVDYYAEAEQPEDGADYYDESEPENIDESVAQAEDVETLQPDSTIYDLPIIKSETSVIKPVDVTSSWEATVQHRRERAERAEAERLEHAAAERAAREERQRIERERAEAERAAIEAYERKKREAIAAAAGATKAKKSEWRAPSFRMQDASYEVLGDEEFVAASATGVFQALKFDEAGELLVDGVAVAAAAGKVTDAVTDAASDAAEAAIEAAAKTAVPKAVPEETIDAMLDKRPVEPLEASDWAAAVAEDTKAVDALWETIDEDEPTDEQAAGEVEAYDDADVDDEGAYEEAYEDGYEDDGYDEPAYAHVPVEVVDVPSLVDMTTAWSFGEPSPSTSGMFEALGEVATEPEPVVAEAYVEPEPVVEAEPEMAEEYEEATPVVDAEPVAEPEPEAYVEPEAEDEYRLADERAAMLDAYQSAAYEAMSDGGDVYDTLTEDDDKPAGFVEAFAEDAADSMADLVEDATDLAGEIAGAVGSAVSSAAGFVGAAAATAAEAMGVATEATEPAEAAPQMSRSPRARDFFRTRMQANRERAKAEEARRAAEAEAAAQAAAEAAAAAEAEAAARAAAEAEEAAAAEAAAAEAAAQAAAYEQASSYADSLTPAPVWGESSPGIDAAAEVDVRPAAWDVQEEVPEVAKPKFEPVVPKASDTAVLHQLFATAPMPIFEPEPEPVPDISATGVLHNLFASMPTIEPYVPAAPEPESEEMPEVELQEAYTWQQAEPESEEYEGEQVSESETAEDEGAWSSEPRVEEQDEHAWYEDGSEYEAEPSEQPEAEVARAYAWDEPTDNGDETGSYAWDEPEAEAEELPEAEAGQSYAWDEPEEHDELTTEAEELPEDEAQQGYAWDEPETDVEPVRDEAFFEQATTVFAAQPELAPEPEAEQQASAWDEPAQDNEATGSYAWQQEEVEPETDASFYEQATIRFDAQPEAAPEPELVEVAAEVEDAEPEQADAYAGAEDPYGEVQDSEVDAEYESMLSSMQQTRDAEPEPETAPSYWYEQAAEPEQEDESEADITFTFSFPALTVEEPEPEVAPAPEPEPETEPDATDYVQETVVLPAKQPVPEPEPAPVVESSADADTTFTFSFPAQPEAEAAPDYPVQSIAPDITFSMERDLSDEDLDDIDTSGLSIISADAEADVAAAMPPVREPIPKPRAVDDPEWGTSSFRPQVMSVGRRAMLLDLPDPSVREVNPFDTHDNGQGNYVDQSQMRRFEVLRNVPSPLNDPADAKKLAEEYARSKAETAAAKSEPEEDGAEVSSTVHPYNSDEGRSIANRSQKKGGRGLNKRFGRNRRAEEPEIESMGEWLGLGDDFDAKKDGREIGSWDRFTDDDDRPAPGRGKWKGGAALRSDLRGDAMGATGWLNIDQDNIQPIPELDGTSLPGEPDGLRDFGDEPIDPDASTRFDSETMNKLREAVLRLGDDDLIAHDIWFVGLGASALDHAGMRAFLDEHRTDIRGCFLINLDSIGAGDLTLLTREGTGRKQRADRRLGRMINSIADALHIDLGRADMSWDETDATPALVRSIRVATLMGMSEDGVPALSQTSNDEPEYLNDQQIADVAEIIAELIRQA